MSHPGGGDAMQQPNTGEHPVVQHPHPTAGVYLRVAAILVILTVLEVGIFSVPSFHPILVPALLFLSAVKFFLVVMFYMHLKMDSRFFSLLFGGPLLLGLGMTLGLMFLFGAFALRR
jgi:cytochrome c oxidase subunit IV